MAPASKRHTQSPLTRKVVTINRAPVLTLWAAVVARRLGFDENEALSLGKAVAGLNAQAKGQRLGIFKPHEQKTAQARAKEHGEDFWVEVCGRPVPATNTPDGVRAVKGSEPINSESVRRYLASKFGDDLKRVRAAMEQLAKALRPKDLAAQAYPLYERFRPEVPQGTTGWGAKGELDLALIRSLAKDQS
jgi:hypothetical protein